MINHKMLVLVALAAMSGFVDESNGQSCVTSDEYGNTGCGTQTLQSNTTGGANTAMGYQALNNNVDGIDNTATGYGALYFNQHGLYNGLRPVTFHYKTDPDSIRQYGLIAEEVEKVYPELVIRNPKGEIQGVRYEELAPMLLRQMQQHEHRFDAQAEVNAKQAATIAAQVTEIRDLRTRYEAMQKQLAELNDLKLELHAALHAEHAGHIGLASRLAKAAENGT